MDEDKKKLWKQAIKWPLYSVAVLPVLITGAYLLNQYEKVKIYNLIAFTLAAILILLWENLTNDLFDAETGIDEFKFHSIVNLVKNKKNNFIYCIYIFSYWFINNFNYFSINKYKHFDFGGSLLLLRIFISRPSF